MQQLLDLIAEMIAILLAEAKEKPELVDGIDNLSEKMITRGELRRKIYLKATALGKNIQCYLTKRNTNSKVY